MRGRGIWVGIGPPSEHGYKLLVRVGVGAVAGLQVGQTIQVVLLGEGVGRLLGHNDIIAEAEGVGRGVAHAHVGMQARHYDRLYAELAQQDVEVGLEESAVTALGHDIVFVREFEFGDHLGTLGAGDGVVAPDLEFTVDAGNVGIVAEDYGNTSLAGSVQKFGRGRYDGFGAVACERAGHEVVEHVDNENRRVVEFFHFVSGLPLAAYKDMRNFYKTPPPYSLSTPAQRVISRHVSPQRAFVCIWSGVSELWQTADIHKKGGRKLSCLRPCRRDCLFYGYFDPFCPV